jgi:hypothetical protein
MSAFVWALCGCVTFASLWLITAKVSANRNEELGELRNQINDLKLERRNLLYAIRRQNIGRPDLAELDELFAAPQGEPADDIA